MFSLIVGYCSSVSASKTHPTHLAIKNPKPNTAYSTNPFPYRTPSPHAHSSTFTISLSLLSGRRRGQTGTLTWRLTPHHILPLPPPLSLSLSLSISPALPSSPTLIAARRDLLPNTRVLFGASMSAEFVLSGASGRLPPGRCLSLWSKGINFRHLHVTIL